MPQQKEKNEEQQEYNDAFEGLKAVIGDQKPNVLVREEYEDFTESGVIVSKPVGVSAYVQDPRTLKLVAVDYAEFHPLGAEDPEYRLRVANKLREATLADLPGSGEGVLASRLPRKGRAPIEDAYESVAYAEFEN